MTRLFVPALIVMLLVGCGENGDPMTLDSLTNLTTAMVVPKPTAEISTITGPSNPPDVQILFSIGQDVGNIDAYSAATATQPGGVTAWIHFHELLQKRGLDNVIMVWQGATHCEGTYEDHPISAWYPGDEYVDWVGLSYFIQEAECDNAPLEEMAAFAREHQKPLLIAEATPQRYDLQNLTISKDGREYEERTPEEIWDSWYTPFFDFITDNADVVRGVAYINARWDDQFMWGPPYTSGYWGDSRVQANKLILGNWQVELAKNTWLQTSPDLFSQLNFERTP